MLRPGDSGNWIEIAYGTSSGTVRVIVQHPETVGSGPQLFQTFSVHRSPVTKIMLSEKHLISGTGLRDCPCSTLLFELHPERCACVSVCVCEGQSLDSGMVRIICCHHNCFLILDVRGALLSVCADNNHVRTWTVTRFRGMISTQPGSTPLTSFKILSLDDIDGHGGCGAGTEIGERCPEDFRGYRVKSKPPSAPPAAAAFQQRSHLFVCFVWLFRSIRRERRPAGVYPKGRP